MLGWLLVAFAAAAAGAIASVDAAAFYAQLNKPSWAPPAWLFGPVWSALYCLIGVSAWLLWRSSSSSKRRAGLVRGAACDKRTLVVVVLRLAPGALAAAEVLVLLALIVCTALAFWRSSRLAALLLVPYVLWVGFASLLTWSVWQRNPSLL